ncbi:MAG: hypothetical protein GX660_24725 [Clostridiaceae bacterium]|nr:hypothetical protein [Clostridiaceae bacterium]
MVERGLNKLFWGFVFIMIGFRIQGFDILPDTVGFLLFASGFSSLSSNSDYFNKASKYNIPMIILSIFSIYQEPAHGEGVHFGVLGILSIPLVIVTVVLNLLVVYYLFMGIKDMAMKKEQSDIAFESEAKWNEYKMLQIAILLSFIMIFLPPLAIAYIFVLFIVSIGITIRITGFVRRCSQRLL